MATNIETMWVGDPEQLQRTVQNLVARGGVVQGQSEAEVSLFIKKKLNIPVLVVGLILCLVPGLAYLAWYLTADQNQQVTVRIGSPDTIKTDHQHWYDSDGTERPPADAAEPAASPPAAATSDPSGLGAADPLTAIPPMPTTTPEPAPAVPPPPAAPQAPPAPPTPPGPPSGGTAF